MEFQTQMCCRENLISERNVLERKLCEKREYLASIQLKQASNFHALLSKHDTLCRDYNLKQKELKVSKEEHGFLCGENDELDEKLEEHRKTIENLKCIRSTHLGYAESLKNQQWDEAENRKKFQNRLQVIALEQTAIDRTMIDVQNKLVEKINEHAELEKNINTEENQSEQLISSINELRIRNEKLNKSFQTEDSEQKNKLDDKLVILVELKQNIFNKQAEIESRKNRESELRSKITTLQNDSFKEKCKFDMEVHELKTKINKITSKISTRCAKLNKMQNVITAFEGHLNDQDVVIKSLELANERALEKIKRIKETREAMKKTISTVREQREKENENSVLEMDMKIQEKYKLEVLIKSQLEHITDLQKQIFDQKIGKSNITRYICEGDL